VAAWPDPDPAWNPLAQQWFELVGAAHPRPTPAVEAAARRWAAEFSAWIEAGRSIPIPMLHEAEEATGAPWEIIREAKRRGDGMRGKLLYWQRVYGQPYPRTADQMSGVPAGCGPRTTVAPSTTVGPTRHLSPEPKEQTCP
jgi:hypothetical protein